MNKFFSIFFSILLFVFIILGVRAEIELSARKSMKELESMKEPEFSVLDIEQVKEKMKTMMEKNIENKGLDRSFKVVDVTLIKESSRKLSGFMTLRGIGTLSSAGDIIKECYATMGLDGVAIMDCR